MNTIKFFSLIAVVSWLSCVLASDCPPERKGLPRFPTQRLNGSLAYSVPPPSSLADLQIVGGVEATPNEFPFIISLQIHSEGNYYHICGGSVYSDKFIITAAHCVFGATASDLRIVAGEHHLNAWSGNEQSIVVQTITIHPNYNSHTQDNDIAILKLSSALNFGDRIAGISLFRGDPSPGTLVAVAGWGALAHGGSSPYILNKVMVSVISNLQCRVNYSPQGYTITDNMICARASGKDSCQGDSGGPLFKIKRSTKKQPKTFWVSTTARPPMPEPTTAPTPIPRVEYEQVGIVSWGNGCAHPDYPGVYTRMNRYIPWIALIAGAQS